MEITNIKKDFEECLLPVRLLSKNPYRSWERNEDSNAIFFVDVQKDLKNKEVFTMFIGRDCSVAILDKIPNKRHIFLLVKTPRNKVRFLLGHDERHLFVAHMRNESKATTINEAFEELKPSDIVQAINNNLKVVRQGEWFFCTSTGVPTIEGLPDQEKRKYYGISDYSSSHS